LDAKRRRKSSIFASPLLTPCVMLVRERYGGANWG
jgi:hypothetical protein